MIQYGAADILMRVLREEIRRQKLRIVDLAKLLKVSEPTVKRYLAGKGVTLEVWTKLYEVLGLNIRQVAERAGSIMVYQQTYTEKQELAFCRTTGLYAFYDHLFNQYSVQEIMAKHKLTQKSAIFYLKSLDDIGLIKWKSGLEFSMLISGEPNWRRNGPLAKKHKERRLSAFFHGKKNSEHTRLARYLLTPEDLEVVREHATAVLTTAWRAEQRSKHLRGGKVKVWMLSLVDQFDDELENYIPNK